MNKKTFKTAVIIWVFLVSAIIGMQNVEPAKANPYLEVGTVPPNATTFPSNITVFSPLNGSTYTKNTIPLSVNVTLPESSSASWTIIYSIIYQADWLQNAVFLYANSGLENSIQSQMPGSEHEYFQKSLNLTDVPDGNHSITITAVAAGTYPAGNLSIYRFYINGSSTVFFTVDSQPPTITIISPQNISYQPPIPLIFYVNEPTSWIGYSLDNQANVTLNGNATLNGLSEFKHSIVIYTNDSAGNMGKSETDFYNGANQPGMPTPSPSPTQQPTIEFTQQPFPTNILIGVNPLPLIIGTIVLILVAIVGLIVYFRRKGML